MNYYAPQDLRKTISMENKMFKKHREMPSLLYKPAEALPLDRVL